MTLDSRQQALLAKAQRTVGDLGIASAVKRVRAIIGPEQIPESEALAQNALEKMRSGEVPTPEEITSLAIVIRILRPVLTIRNDTLPALPSDPEHELHSEIAQARWEAFRVSARTFVGSVGRIESYSGDHVGTGFLVRECVLATNRHVLEQLTFGSGVLLPSRPARICFGREDGVLGGPNDIVPIEGVVDIHPNLDLALLSVPRQYRALPILSLQEPLEAGKPVAVIGYPAQDSQNPAFLAPVFNGTYGVKRASIGELLDGNLLDKIFHDCSTTQGSSGSPVFSLTSGHVIAIHCGGRFMYRNDAAPYCAWREFLQSNLQ